MRQRDTMLEWYEDYKKSEDRVVQIDGQEYHKIINITNVFGKNIITLPQESIKKSSKYIKDENGNIFEMGDNVYLSFAGPIPNWYFETLQVTIFGKEIDKIGKYIRQIDSI